MGMYRYFVVILYIWPFDKEKIPSLFLPLIFLKYKFWNNKIILDFISINPDQDCKRPEPYSHGHLWNLVCIYTLSMFSSIVS